MKKLILAALIAVAAIAAGLSAQEQSKIKLDLIYTFEQAKQGNPLPEIMKALQSRGKSVPQEDIDWVLNSVRVDLARSKHVLYYNDGGEMRLPEDTRKIVTSKNNRFIVVYIDDQKERVFENLKGSLAQRQLHSATRRDENEWLHRKAERANDKEGMRKHQDSIKYYIAQIEARSDSLSNFYSYHKLNKRSILIDNENGKILWDRDDVKYPWFISNDGKVIIGVQKYGEYDEIVHQVFFYDERGALINANVVNGCGGAWGWRNLFDLSADGGIFGIMTWENNIGFINAYDKTGNLLWKYKNSHDGRFSNACFSISDDHKRIAVSDYYPGGKPFIMILDEAGSLHKKYDFTAYKPVYTQDGRYVVYPCDDKKIYLCDVGKGNILWVKYVDKMDLEGICSSTKDGGKVFIRGVLITEKGNGIYDTGKDGVISSNGKIILTYGGLYYMEVGK